MFYREELNNGDSSWYNHHLQERQAKLGCIYHQIPIHIRPVSLNKESRDTPISHKVYAYRQAPKHIIGRRVSAFYENRETPISRIAGQRHEYTCSHERVNVRYRPIAPSENWEALVSGRSEPHHVYNHSLTHFNPPRSLIRENTECPSSYISRLRYQYNLELERRYQRKPPNENRNMPVSQRSGVRVKYMDKPIVNRYKTPILNKSKNAKSHEQMDNGCPQQSTTANRETCISHISKGRQIFNQELTGFSSPLTHYNRKPNDIDLPDTGIRAISGQTKPFIEDYFQNCDKKAYNIRCSSENAERLQEKEYFIRHESNPGIRRGESAERSVVDAIERMRIHFGAGDVEPMCLISGFEFENYLKHLKTADMIGHADRISAKRYLSRRDNGEHDILILHLNHGVTFIQVKAIGESMQVADSEGYWKAVKKRKDQHNRKIKDFIERALKQLDRDERMFRHVMKDLHLNIPVRKVVALPNIRRETLVNLSSSVSVLRQHLGLDALERCLFANEVHCRDVSDTSPLSLWWARNIQSYPGFKDVDTYKNVIDIYCNMMPTGKRPSSQAVPENCDTNMEVQTTEYNAEYNGTPIPDPCTCLTEESVAETEYSDTPVPDPCTFLTEESVAETEYSDTPVPDPGTCLTEESVAETEYSDTPVPDPCTCLTEESVAENEYSDTLVPDPCTCLTEEPVAETEYSDTPVPDPCTFLTEESVAETEYSDTPVPDPCTFLTEESVAETEYSDTPVPDPGTFLTEEYVAETEYSDTPVPDPCTFLTEESVAVTEYSDNKMVLHTEDQDVETKPEEDEVGNSTKIPEKISHRVSLFHYKLSNDLEDSVKSGPTDFLFHEPTIAEMIDAEDIIKILVCPLPNILHGILDKLSFSSTDKLRSHYSRYIFRDSPELSNDLDACVKSGFPVRSPTVFFFHEPTIAKVIGVDNIIKRFVCLRLPNILHGILDKPSFSSTDKSFFSQYLVKEGLSVVECNVRLPEHTQKLFTGRNDGYMVIFLRVDDTNHSEKAMVTSKLDECDKELISVHGELDLFKNYFVWFLEQDLITRVAYCLRPDKVFKKKAQF